MLSVNSSIMGNLASSSRQSQIGLHRAFARVQKADDSLESTRQSGDSGQYAFASRLSGDTRHRSAHLNNLQNATTYVQMQQAGLDKAAQVFDRMSKLAMQASDPFLNYAQRQSLNEEMDGLKKELESLRTADFQGKYLYDDLASYTAKSVDFGDALDETQPPTESNVYTTFYKNQNRPVNRWTSTKDVLYNSGRMILEVNGGGHGERYYVKQGENIIFDTGQWWETSGHAYQYDFDKFIIDFAPGKDTTFEFVPMDTAGGEDTRQGHTPAPNGNFDNQSFYSTQLGTSDFSSSFINAGQVTTARATTESSEISVVVESTSLFQISAKYEQTGPTNFQTIGQEGSNEAVTLTPVGFGTMSGMGIGTIEDAKSTLDAVLEEIKGIGIQIGRLGSNFSLIQQSSELSGEKVAAGQVALARMNEDEFPQSSLEFAMQKIKMDSNVALMTQAKDMSKKIYSLLW